jgi:chaperonin GroEL
MTHKHLLFQSEAREKIVRGATQLADAVRVTLGPKSKSVLMQKNGGHPSFATMASRSPKRSS